jgi:hypothetical protein
VHIFPPLVHTRFLHSLAAKRRYSGAVEKLLCMIVSDLMALIEQLESENWRELLRTFWWIALESLKNDPYGPVGSSVDDLRAWLRQGGVARVKEHLQRQMAIRQFSEDRKKAVLDAIEILLQESRSQIVTLMDHKVIPPEQQTRLSAFGLSESDIAELLTRIMAGERPFEDWMYAHGHSKETIAKVYKTIDEWLMARGLIPLPSERGH